MKVGRARNVRGGGRLAVGCACALWGAHARAQTTTLASHVETFVGLVQPAGLSGHSISADGRWVLFYTAQRLSTQDTNGVADLYIRDRWLGGFELVSQTSSGVAANGFTNTGSITPDGRWVVFVSFASDLVAGDTNFATDVFVRDRASSSTERVNVSSSGVEALAGVDQVVALSDDGRFAAFASSADNLVAGDTNATSDVFLRDRQTQQTVRVSVSANGSQASGASGTPQLSADGQLVTFSTVAENLAPQDSNGFVDVLLRDMSSGVVELISVSSAGVQGNDDSSSASLSGDGRFVAFTSSATNLVSGDTNGVSDVFLRDRATATTKRISVSSIQEQAAGLSFSAQVSRDGRFVGFSSAASNLVSGDTNTDIDAFLHHRESGLLERVNLTWSGGQPIDGSNGFALSADARFVAFASNSDQIVPWNLAISQRVYVRDRLGVTPQRYCTAAPNSAGCMPQIDWRGEPSASAGSDFLVGARQVLPQRMGLVFYGSSGPSSSALQVGTLCVSAPRRTSAVLSSATGAAPCTGEFAIDFNRWIAAQPYPATLYGKPMWAQCWSRDPAAPGGGSVSDALSFVIGL